MKNASNQDKAARVIKNWLVKYYVSTYMSNTQIHGHISPRSFHLDLTEILKIRFKCGLSFKGALND